MSQTGLRQSPCSDLARLSVCLSRQRVSTLQEASKKGEVALLRQLMQDLELSNGSDDSDDGQEEMHTYTSCSTISKFRRLHQ